MRDQVHSGAGRGQGHYRRDEHSHGTAATQGSGGATLDIVTSGILHVLLYYLNRAFVCSIIAVTLRIACKRVTVVLTDCRFLRGGQSRDLADTVGHLFIFIQTASSICQDL